MTLLVNHIRTSKFLETTIQQLNRKLNLKLVYFTSAKQDIEETNPSSHKCIENKNEIFDFPNK